LTHTVGTYLTETGHNFQLNPAAGTFHQHQVELLN